MIERIQKWLRQTFTQKPSTEERAPQSRASTRRKTLKGATHTHRGAGHGRRRRGYLPAIVGLFARRRRMRPACRFVYARPSRQASRDARLRVITSNDRLENAVQRHRLEEKGLRVA